MKFILLLLLTLISFGSVAYAAQPTHRCQIYTVVQRYELPAMKFVSAEELKSPWFNVTDEPHEAQKDFELQGAGGTAGTSKVWTGTLLNTTEGDVLQAHATFKIAGASGSANLIMSLDSRLAKASVVLDYQTASEFFLIPVDLKCERI